MSTRVRHRLIWLAVIGLFLVVFSVVFGLRGGHGDGGLHLGPVTTTK